MCCHSLCGVPKCLFCPLLLKPVKAGNFLVLIRSFLVPSGLSQEFSECSFGTELTSAGWIPLENWCWGLPWDKPHVPERETCPAPDAFAVCSHQETLLPLSWGSPSSVVGCPERLWDLHPLGSWEPRRVTLLEEQVGQEALRRSLSPSFSLGIVWNALWTENPKKSVNPKVRTWGCYRIREIP